MELNELQKAIDHRDYGKAIETASAALDEIQDRLAITLLNYRAYAFSMQGKYKEAEEDAQAMIAAAPTIPLGYCRLGNLYQLQGKRQSAIRAYELGLQMVSADDPRYGLMLKSKETAEKQDKGCVDFIAKLPIEVVDEIIGLLPQNHKLVCLQVSEVWRVKLLACTEAWRVLTAEGGHVAAAMDDIAIYVRELTINTDDTQLLNTCLLSMRHGRFSKINTLKFSPTTMKYINTSMMMLVTNAFRQASTTLTKLVIDHHTGHTPMVLADLLVTFSNLQILIYNTTNRLSDIVGEFPLPEPHGLISLKLYALQIDSPYIIQPILLSCPELQCLGIDRRYSKRRRTSLQYREGSIFDIVDRTCTKLKRFTFNIRDEGIIPGPERFDSSQDFPGLQELYVIQHRHVEPLLQLLQRNAATLKTMHLRLYEYPPHRAPSPVYQNLVFKRLEKLTLACSSVPAVSLLYNWISKCDTLMHLDILLSYDIPQLVDILISRSRLTSLSFAWTPTSVSSHLTRLFHSYAADLRRDRPFENIALRSTYVNDSVLDGLSAIQTLQRITLMNLKDVSTEGLTRLFRSLGESTKTIHLSLMDSVTDQHLIIIGRLKCLETVHLQSLDMVTDDGVWKMVNKAFSLHNLAIVDCEGVSEQTTAHARSKVKNAK